ncbi:MAG: hypothetical protein ACLP5V_04650 [Candidatus Bathyarchaeia archaeon]
MCQCQQPMFNPYVPPEQSPYPYYPEQSAYPYYAEQTPYPYYPEQNPYPYYAPNPILVPYPTHTFTYDPYWASRVTPSTHPLVFVSTQRFRGEVRSGNCLLIYE